LFYFAYRDVVGLGLFWGRLELIKRLASLAGICFFLASAQVSAEQISVEIEALLGNTAVININGERQTLRMGQTVDGVTLLAADPHSATVEINGQSQTLGLSQRVGTAYLEPTERVVTIARDAMMKYQTNATINGRSALVLVDTGANIVAISGEQAKAMNIDYSAGEPATVETASGLSSAHGITLRSVVVGGIEVNNVPAMVVDGAFPATILLGMSYLRHVKLQEHNGILSLSRSE
jgi:aspartyl protease family protein